MIIVFSFAFPWSPGSSDNKESACNVGDAGLIPGLGRSPREGTDNPLQYSCLENPMDGGVWQATCHGVTKIQTKLSDFTFTFTLHCPGLCRFRTPICTDGPQNSEHFPCPSHLSSGWLKGMALRGTDFGRNDAKAETPVLWPPHAKS